MPYATVADLRAEGVTESQASDARLEHIIAEASALVDLETGWWFEPKRVELALSGRGTPTLEPPVPPIRLDSMLAAGVPIATDDETLFVVGAPVRWVPHEPEITLTRGVFPRGRGNVVITGVFGYTEPDGTPEGRTPLAIRRAAMQMVLRLLPQLADRDAVVEARDRLRIVEERTRDAAIKFAPIAAESIRSHRMDPEVFETLQRYARPMRLGAV